MINSIFARFAWKPTIVAFSMAFVASCAGPHVGGTDQPSDMSETAGVETIELPTTRANGESYRMETIIVSEERRGQQTVRSEKHRSIGRATVRHVTPLGHTLVWDVEDYEMDGNALLPDTLVERLERMEEDTPIRIKMDRFGSVSSLANRQEVTAVIQRSLQEISGELRSQGMPEQVNALVQSMMGQMNDPEYLENAVLEHARLYYFLCGVELEVDAVYSLDDQLVSPFLGQPIPGKFYYGISEIDHDARTVTFEVWREPDHEVLRSQLKAFMSQAAQSLDGGQQVVDGIDFDDFEVAYEGTIVYSLENGLPLAMKYSEDIVFGELSKSERVAIRTML